MNLKAGDKVRIREDLKLREYLSSDSTYKAIVVHKMMEYKGKVATIKRTHYVGINIDLDNGKWCRADTMFEEIEKEKVNETHNKLLEQFVNNSMNILGNMK